MSNSNSGIGGFELFLTISKPGAIRLFASQLGLDGSSTDGLEGIWRAEHAIRNGLGRGLKGCFGK
jgi:hypothetical protein